MFHIPDQHRKEVKGFPSDKEHGICEMPLPTAPKGSALRFWVIATAGFGWEHVSVSIRNEKAGFTRTPTWEEMCYIKGLFWDDDDAVVQFHPPKSEYVNNHPHCLHLWKPIGVEIPRPDPLMVGIPNKK